ncbi:MAG TPA: SPFH domain-containing protein [Sedimentisphaerales bacterium]|nr:SPFH domain-containing protein [Sedimentisphaerales bacterium]
MKLSSQRAEHVALASLILSVIFFGVAFFIGRWSGAFAVFALSWLILATAIIWFVLCLHFHQRSLAEREKLDMTQLAKDEQASTIFQAKGERATLFAAAQRRLGVFEKWFIPIFSIVIAVYQIAIGLYLLKAVSATSDVEPKQPLLVAICMTAIAFVSFLMSRYATGMSAEPQWKPLRAGGSFLLATAVLCFALAVSMALIQQFKIFVVINIINWVVPILLAVLGAETALNVVLDIYRPRLKDQYARTAFDSRLLGVISEPGGILRSAADAIDYQFGFKVSQTWFYKLLEKAIVPLVLFAAFTLYLLSCIVVVAANEEAIIEHFGNPLTDANSVRVVGPGLAFKWPWPIDKIYKYPTKKVSEISIGFVPKVDPKTGELSREPLLWGEHHYKEEYQLLVASEQTFEGSTAGAVPVSLLIAAVPVQYRVKDLYSFIYKHDEPERLLESICYRELTRFAAGQVGSKDEGAAGVQETLLGAGRAEAKRILTTRIQQAVDEAVLGVEIVFLGLQGIHPPPDVAADYQQVIGAVQKKQALILDAQAERNKTLTTLVGSVQDANELYSLAAKYQEAKKQNQSEQIRKLGNDLDQAFVQASGDIYKTLRESHSYTFEIATLAQATSRRFASQLKAYRAAEQIYLREQVLAARVEALKGIRKYVVIADPNSLQVFIVDVTEKQIPSLYDFESSQESSQK